MNKKNNYNIYGLNVLSEIDLPASKFPAEVSDIEIIFGNVNYPPENYSAKGACFYVKPSEVYFEIKDIARYQISDGNKIVIEKFPQADLDAVKLFLNGPVFGALLLQRNILPFHSSAFEYKGKAVLLAGSSGIGKSTLAAYLLKNNYPIISDDISALDIVEDKLLLYSSGNYLKLWKDSLNKLDFFSNELKKVRNNIEKYIYPIQSSVLNWEVSRIYILGSHNSSNVEIRAVRGIEKFKILKDNTYRKILIKGLKMEQKFLNKTMQIAANVPISQVKRPNFGFEIETLGTSIINDLENG